MLSKEEIENKINLKDRTKYAIEKSKKIIKEHKEEKGDCSIEVSLAYDMQYVEKYINQLESDKQKLIEKLEKEIKCSDIMIEATKIEKFIYRNEIDAVINSAVKLLNKYRLEILEIVKGEKNE